MLIFLLSLYNKGSVVAEMGNHLATINIGRREEAAMPLSGGEMGPIKNNVAWAEAYLHLSLSLSHRIVWPQYTNVTDRQDRQTDRQRSDSIGRTVLQTVAKN